MAIDIKQVIQHQTYHGTWDDLSLNTIKSKES